MDGGLHAEPGELMASGQPAKPAERGTAQIPAPQHSGGSGGPPPDQHRTKGGPPPARHRRHSEPSRIEWPLRLETASRGFQGSPGVESPLPVQGTRARSWTGKTPLASEHRSTCATIAEPVLPSPGAASADPRERGAWAPHGKPGTAPRGEPLSLTTGARRDLRQPRLKTYNSGGLLDLSGERGCEPCNWKQETVLLVRFPLPAATQGARGPEGSRGAERGVGALTQPSLPRPVTSACVHVSEWPSPQEEQGGPSPGLACVDAGPGLTQAAPKPRAICGLSTHPASCRLAVSGPDAGHGHTPC